MKISIACDHAGFDLKETIKSYLLYKKYEISDFGAFDTSSVDYVDTGLLASENVSQKKSNFGILICGTGQGMNIIANKVKGIRAALCYNVEIAKLARQHNDANILVLGGRFTSALEGIEIVDAFLNEPFSKEIRHSKRVEKIEIYENNPHISVIENQKKTNWEV